MERIFAPRARGAAADAAARLIPPSLSLTPCPRFAFLRRVGYSAKSHRLVANPMPKRNIVAGIFLLLVAIILLAFRYFRTLKRGRFRAWGWIGLGIILVAEGLLFGGSRWVAIFITPIAWTGYLLLADAAVWSLEGESRLGKTPSHFLALAFWSVPLWLVFEAYNLRLENWTYVGLPDSLLVRCVGSVWSFATIWPAIFETADFVKALGFFRPQAPRRLRLSFSAHLGILLVGLVFVTVPVLVPASAGRYLFGAVWMGFILLLDPLNYYAKGRSLLRDLETGSTSTVYSLLMSGLICGILWEFWNYGAAAKWVYVFPILQVWKIFAMPLPGYLGFPAFALECFVMYEFLRTLRRQLLKVQRGPDREATDQGGSPDVAAQA